MAIGIFDAFKRQEYRLEKVLAARGHDAEQARVMAKKIEYEMQLEYHKEHYERHEIETRLKEKLFALESKFAQEKAEAKIAATQAALNAPHMQCTLSTAADMWIVKFGDGWVPKQKITGAAGEMNWQALGCRLADAHRMEEYEDFWRIIT
jgi:hypothetical protein